MSKERAKPAIFYKYSAAGNDFIMIDDRSRQFPTADSDLIQNLCARRTGIGADGLILLQPSERAAFRMRYFNADGFESEMCGNGSRCIAHFGRELGIIAERFQFESMLDLHEGGITDTGTRVKVNPPRNVNVGKPELPNLGAEIGGYVEIGVPHYVLFYQDISALDVEKIGGRIAHAQAFENGTNVNFVCMKSENELDLRTFERGVEAETLACGTGAAASALFAAKLKGAKSPVQVNVLGGNLRIEFDDDFGHIWLSGPVEQIYRGEVDIRLE